MSRRVGNSGFRVLVATLLATAVVGPACAGRHAGGDGSGGDDPGTPVVAGEVVYGLENETSGGWCLPESQLAISGIQVATTIYDTLTAPNENDEYVPFLAESVEPNEDYTQWTITLREGIVFHDGTPLTAKVVKNNLDAYRGQYPARSPLLFVFVFENIASVTVVDDLTLTIATTSPWPALPAALYGSGRIGMMAQAQLDDPETCDTNLIGTGPFKLDEWIVNDHLTASRNADYWRTDANGTQLPYLDSIEYRPIVDEAARLNALESGQLQAMQTNEGASIEQIDAGIEAGTLGGSNTEQFSEVEYLMFNVTRAPFDNQLARHAVAAAFDGEEYRSITALDQLELASGPFAPGVIGYLEDTGFPDYDPDQAKELVARYEAETDEPLSFTLVGTTSPSVLTAMSLIQDQMKAVGIDMDIDPIEQAQQINIALGDDWQAQLWRNHPGGDPDTQYGWWYGGSPVNFNKFDDPEMNALLDRGRAEPDPEVRRSVYEQINRLFAERLYNVWTTWSNWTVGTATDVHGILGPALPDGTEPFPGLATGHPASGIWISN